MNIKRLWVIVLALGLGLFTRTYQLWDRFNYAHDNDLASWVVKDIVVDKHLRLIGQLTSSPGVFIGPLWYYLQIPFYLIGNMDPGYVPLLSVGVGLLAVISIYWVIKQIYSQRSGLIACIIYAVSWGVSGVERDVVPTNPVFLWSIWFLYAVDLLLKGNKKGLLLVALLWGLIWHIHLALVFSVPLVIGILIFNKGKFKFSDLLVPMIVLAVMSLPLLVFEARHQLSQTRSLLATGSPSTRSVAQLQSKAFKVVLFTAKNANSVFWVKPNSVPVSTLPLLLLVGAAYLVNRGVIKRNQAVVYGLWWLVYLVMFSLNPLNLSEYYLNGLSILWLLIAALLVNQLYDHLPKMALIVLVGFCLYNLWVVINIQPDQSGYLQKKSLVEFIASDAKSHDYPCVAISYMVDPGRDLGYRYWFFLNNLHVNQPQSGSPVYTVVFPHPRAGRLDKTFGALGLVLPQYSRYTQQQVNQSCQGVNANLTDPMFGFTK